MSEQNTSMAVTKRVEVIESLADMKIAAQYIVDSKMFGLQTIPQVVALGMIAQAEGRPFASVARDYDTIQGRPALKSVACLARFQQAGGVIEWIERNDKVVTASFTHPQVKGALRVTWDMARATAAGLTAKDNWRKYPCQMLSSRVLAEGVRATFPACLSGVYLVEEIRDFDNDAPKDITAQVTTSAPSAIDTAKQKVKAAAPKKPPATSPAAEAPKQEPAAPATPTPAAPTTPPTPAPAADPNAWKAKLCGAFLSKHGLTQKQLEAWRQKDLDAWVQEDREFFLAQFKDAKFNAQEVKDYLAACESAEKGAPDPDAPPAEADEVLPPEDPNAAV
jgi:hypothetical protein